MKKEDSVTNLSPEGPANPSRRDFIKKSSVAALTAVAAPALLTKYARASERPIKIGCVLPKTGVLAAFTEPEEFVYSGVEKVFAKGITVNRKNHPVEIIRKDSRSDPNRAAEVASALIKSDKVDLMLAAHTGDTCNPVSDQSEINGVPCCTCDDPVDAWFFGRGGNPAKGFQWTYHFFWGNDEMAAVYTGIWNSLPTNKIVSVLFPNDNDGRAVAIAFPPLLKAKGFNLIDLGRFDIMTNDFSAQISQFKQAKAEICTGVFASRLYYLLAAGGAARLQTKNLHHGQGGPIPGSHQRARGAWAGSDLRGLVVALPSLQVKPDGTNVRAICRGLGEANR